MRITLNIEKRYVYTILATLIILTGIVVVYAYNSDGSGGNPAVFGHDASEVGAGFFPGNSYEFPQGIVRLGGFGNNRPGQIEFRGGQTNNNNLIVLKNNGTGFLQVSNDGVNNYFSLAQTGNITMKTGATLYASNINVSDKIILGGVAKNAWPSYQLQSQWFDNSCPSGWTDTSITDEASASSSPVDHDLNEDNHGSGISRLCLRIVLS